MTDKLPGWWGVLTPKPKKPKKEKAFGHFPKPPKKPHVKHIGPAAVEKAHRKFGKF